MSVADFEALMTEFNNNWSRSVDTILDNESYEPNLDVSFVRFSIRPSGQVAKAGGRALLENQGRVWLQIFIPEGQGQALALDLVDEFKSIFSIGKRLDGGAIIIHESNIPPPTTKDGFYSMNVSVRWTSLRRP